MQPKPRVFRDLVRLRGWSYAELPEELAARLAPWLEQGPDAECELLKPGRVWSWRAVVVKRYEPGALERTGLRASGARRAAGRHYSVLPVRTPAPLAVVEIPRGPSLLASERIEGRALHVAWGEDPAARAAFPGFLASMHAQGVFHGDLHAGNVLWDGREWVLIDLEGLRHPLRVLSRRWLVVEQWSRVYFGLSGAGDVRAAFDAYAGASGLGRSRERIWDDAVARAEQRRDSIFGAGRWS